MTKNNRGFIKTVVLIIIALAVLKIVWNFDLFQYLDNPTVRKIIGAISDSWRWLWNLIKPIFSVFSK